MDKDTRNAIERATQRGRRLLEEDFAAQLEATFDVHRDGAVAPKAGSHLAPRQIFQRDKIIAAIEHKRAAGMSAAEAVVDYLRDAAFTTLNRFAALKMLEARDLVLECITKGEQSAGYREFCGMAPGVALLPDSAGYRLYIESLFDELSTEVKVLFDRRDPASVLWPKRLTFENLLDVLNGTDLVEVWREDETIGWVYQFFNFGGDRKKMREESRAPRSGRELAIRNQFFTPRYVVEFLVDNTLGRMWLEMQANDSRLKKQCRYFVKNESGHERTRPRKDPRDLRILDPACGSGHFLLYCFDLLQSIYEEAWENEGPGPLCHESGTTLRDDYPDLEALKIAIPALILERNLHGVDIDQRAAQIAALALWLRAQRAWKDGSVDAAMRPRTSHTNVVVAEPMPRETILVEEFALRLEPPLLGNLFRKMVSEMRLAGELGTLIPIDEGIEAELRKAREQFASLRGRTGYLPGMEPTRKSGDLDLSGIDDDTFFQKAEVRIMDTLRHFVEAAAGGAGVRRRLFAGDAGQGIALIDILRTRFDVVLMNPPFGAASNAVKKDFEKAYPRTKNDIYAAFVERGVSLLGQRGLLGAITSRTGFFLSSFQKWREEVLLKEAPPIVVADLGHGVMDAAMVEAAAYCLEKVHETSTRKTVFFHLSDAEDKAAVLAKVLNAEGPPARCRFDVNLQSFRALPLTPFAYSLPPSVLRAFAIHPSLEQNDISAKRGAYTTDDFRVNRLWWEVASASIGRDRQSFFHGRTNAYLAKGGAYASHYADLALVLRWTDDGAEAKAFLSDYRTRKGWGTDWSACINGYSHYFRPGLTYSIRSQRGLSFRVLPAGCIFSLIGPAIFIEGNSPTRLLSLLSVLNSKAFSICASAQVSFGMYQVGAIQRTPIPKSCGEDEELAELARREWSLKRALDTCIETSHAFTLPAILQVRGATLHTRLEAWTERIRAIETEIQTIQTQIDEKCFAYYGINEAEYADAPTNIGGGSGTLNDASDESECDIIDEEVAKRPVDDYLTVVADLVAWCVNVAFGRFDVRIATQQRSNLSDPEPFDPLPLCPPGMFADNDELPLLRPPPDYPLVIPAIGVLVDDTGRADDLTSAVHSVLGIAFNENPDRWWTEISARLDSRDHELRNWIAHEYFEHHLKRYSKSRRKAPIYWQLATPSASYSVWLYTHAFTKDTFYKVQNECAVPKLAHEERMLESLRREAGESPRPADRKSLAVQETFVEELRAFLDEVKRVAPLWNPDLDDGVIINFAPLWRLVPHHKQWQKELKITWDALCDGDYDWAHLSMHLWPERVVPKCATDRSLAIAHGLEDAFWVEGSDGKWKERAKPTKPVEELVKERSSAAVKAALKSLLEAPSPSGTTQARGRRGATKKGSR